MTTLKTLDTLAQRFEWELAPYDAGSGIALPPAWSDYLLQDQSARRRALNNELSYLGRYFPEASAQLDRIADDAIIGVHKDRGLCRFISVNIDGYPTWYYSMAPLRYAKHPPSEASRIFMERAPAALCYVHQELMDGLTDMLGFVGFQNTSLLMTVQEQIDTYGEAYYFDELAAKGDLSKMIDYFSSGGGAGLVLDLTTDQRDVKIAYAMRLSADPDMEWRPQPEVELFPYLDAWMAIGMGSDE